MQYGTIVQYFPAKRFGFIRPDAGPDVFFHVSALGACTPLPRLEPGQPVKFELDLGSEPPLRRARRSDAPTSGTPEKKERREARLVELIDKIPGGVIESSEVKRTEHHPRARQKKPTWRR